MVLKIEKLTEPNFYVWKEEIEVLVTLCDVQNPIATSSPHKLRSLENNEWCSKEKVAKVLVGRPLYENNLEKVMNVSSAKEMWETTLNIFQNVPCSISSQIAETFTLLK